MSRSYEIDNALADAVRMPIQMLGWRFAHWRDMPRVSGLYAVFIGGSLMYIGKAVNMRQRFANHQIDINRIAYREFRGSADTAVVAYREYPDKEEIDAAEAALVYTLQPPHNICLRRSPRLRGAAL